MSEKYQVKVINFDVDNQIPVDEGGNRLSSFFLYRGTQVLFKSQLVDKDNVAFALPNDGTRNGGNVFIFGIDTVVTPDHSDLALSTNEDFNDTDDWADVDLDTGKICWRLNLDTAEIKAAIGTSSYLNVYANLWIIPPGKEPFLVCQWRFSIYNIAIEVGTLSPINPGEYATLEFVDNVAAKVAPTNGLYRVKDLTNLQFKNVDTDKWHTVFIKGAAGLEHLEFGAGED